MMVTHHKAVRRRSFPGSCPALLNYLKGKSIKRPHSMTVLRFGAGSIYALLV